LQGFSRKGRADGPFASLPDEGLGLSEKHGV